MHYIQNTQRLRLGPLRWLLRAPVREHPPKVDDENSHVVAPIPIVLVAIICETLVAKLFYLRRTNMSR